MQKYFSFFVWNIWLNVFDFKLLRSTMRGVTGKDDEQHTQIAKIPISPWIGEN